MSGRSGLRRQSGRSARKTFADICKSMGTAAGVGNASTALGGPLKLKANYHAEGAGYQESIVVESETQPALHLTIYQTSRDASGPVPNHGDAPLGPCGLHLTYKDQGDQSVRHVFYKNEAGKLWRLTDNKVSDDEKSTAEQQAAARKAAEARAQRESKTMAGIMETVGPHLN